MQVNAIIAEYNPFHNGHAFQLKDALNNTGASKTIIVMSGNFVQRGEPAFIDKYKRTKSALENGADLVLELPAYYSTASAELFAKGAVSIINKLGVVDNLCFGCETDDIKDLKGLSEILSNEPIEYRNLLKEGLSNGLSFPLARKEALAKLCPELNVDCLDHSNNILAVEYLKAINLSKSLLTPYFTKRQGAKYNDSICETPTNNLTNDKNFASAKGIREAYQNNTANNMINYLPPSSLAQLLASSEQNQLVFPDNLSDLLRYKLHSETNKDFSIYMDVTEDLSDRINNLKYKYESFTQFIELLKTKNLTYTRISRALLHIVLNMTKEKLDSFYQDVPYIRVLGLKKDSSALIKRINQSCDIPIITKTADYKKQLDERGQLAFEEELRISEIYYYLYNDNKRIISEHTLSPIIL